MATCRRDRKEACPDRYDAVRAGRCWFSWQAQGWFIIDRGIPTLFEHCRWCGGSLPVLTDVILRALTEAEDDGD